VLTVIKRHAELFLSLVTVQFKVQVQLLALWCHPAEVYLPVNLVSEMVTCLKARKRRLQH
jgi:hypothetical protein